MAEDRSYDKSELNKIFHTKDEDYLTSNSVEVIKRKFNANATLQRIPARTVTDEKVAKTHYYEQVAVVSDFPKSMVSSDLGKMWTDGTYNDALKAISKDNQQYDTPIIFAKDADFEMRLSRLDREQNSQAIMANYFAQRVAEQDAEKRVFLTEYGLSPTETETVMAQVKVENALTALKSTKRHYVPGGKGVDNMLRSAIDKMVLDKNERATAELADPGTVPTPASQSIEETSKRIGGRPLGETTLRIAREAQEKIDSARNSKAGIANLKSNELKALLMSNGVISSTQKLSVDDLKAKANELFGNK